MGHFIGGGEVIIRLVERDYQILRELDRWRFCLGRHIRELAGFSGTRACDRRLKFLREAGYISRKRILYGVPSVYFLTSLGANLLGIKHKEPKIRTDNITHDIAVLDTAIHFTKEHNVSLDTIETEKQLYSKNGFSTRKHCPDFVITNGTKSTCVEVELTLKAKARLENIVSENYSTYDKQIWVVPKSENKIRSLLSEFSDKYQNTEIIDLEEIQKNVREHN